MNAKSSSGTSLPLIQPDWSPVATVRCDYQSAGQREDGKYVEHDMIPHLCHIDMTYARNEKCIFCYNPERAKLGDLSAIDRIIRSVAESQIPHVYLIGGEPSLLPVEKFNEYIELLSEHSSVTIVTNGHWGSRASRASSPASEFRFMARTPKPTSLDGDKITKIRVKTKAQEGQQQVKPEPNSSDKPKQASATTQQSE